MKPIFKTYMLPILSLLLVLTIWFSAEALKGASLFLPRIFEKNLPIGVNPLRVGGEASAVVFDPIDDVGSADLMTYTVRLPYKDMHNKTTWSLDFEFKEVTGNNRAANGFEGIKAGVYIDLPGPDNDGNSLPYNAITPFMLPEGFTWDYYVEFDDTHKTGILVDASGKNRYDLAITYFEQEGVIRLGLPVVGKLKKALEKRDTGQHIVFCLASPAPFSPENPMEPAYQAYDVLNVSHDKTPLAVSMKSSDNGFANQLESVKKRLTAITGNYETYPNPTLSEAQARKGIEAYNAGRLDEAMEILKEHGTGSAVGNTYLGLISATLAGDNKTYGPMQQMALVQSAYTYFEEAEQLMSTNEERYFLLSNRIGISVEVPDEVFNKDESAIEDIKEILTIITDGEETLQYQLKLVKLYEKRNQIRELRLLVHSL